MADIVYIKEDLVTVKTGAKSKVVLAWGDPVEVLGYSGGRTRVRVHDRGPHPFTGTVKGRLPTQKESVLQFSMIDVQQGDGMIMQTPRGKRYLSMVATTSCLHDLLQRDTVIPHKLIRSWLMR